MSTRPRFLVIRFSSIGDIVLTTPVLRALKEQIEPEPEIHFLTKQQYAPILEANPRIDKVYAIEKATAEVMDELKEAEFDYIIDLHRNIRSSMVKRGLKMIDFTFKKRNYDKWLLVNFGIDKLGDEHIVQRYLATLQAFGIEEDDGGLEYYISEGAAYVDTQGLLTEPYVAIALGATHAGKVMTTTLLEEVIQTTDARFVLLGGPEDGEKGKALARTAPDRVLNFAGELSLHESASVIEQSTVVLTGDTGLMHIAAAFQKNIVSVWGCTTPSLGMSPYRPGEKSIIIEPTDRKKRPCSKLGDRCKYGKNNRCITAVSAEEISRALTELL